MQVGGQNVKYMDPDELRKGEETERRSKNDRKKEEKGITRLRKERIVAYSRQEGSRVG